MSEAGVALLPGGNVLSPEWLMSPRPFHSALAVGTLMSINEATVPEMGRTDPNNPKFIENSQKSTNNQILKNGQRALAGVAQWIGCWPANKRVAGLFPSQGNLT